MSPLQMFEILGRNLYENHERAISNRPIPWEDLHDESKDLWQSLAFRLINKYKEIS